MFQESLNIFMPLEKNVDSYPLDHLIDMINEHGLFESEHSMAISSVDHYRKSIVRNYNAKIDVFQCILNAFDVNNLKIPVIFDDEIKMLEFLTSLKLNKTIKFYKNYIKAKENYDNAIEMKQDIQLDDNMMTQKEYARAVLDAKLQAFHESSNLHKLDFESKMQFFIFQEKVSETDVYKELKKYLQKQIKAYQKKIKQINSFAEDAIDSIENDEDIVEKINDLREFIQ